jgi:transposase
VAGWRIYVEFERWRVDCPRCGGVYVERLDWLAKNPRFTQQFAMHVGALCREMTNKAVAELERLHDSTVKDLDKIYMRKQVERAGLPAPRAIGVDEIAIRKGHNYRIVVSDLDRGRPIWVGSHGRTEADFDAFFAALGPKKTARIELAAMDMWKPFRNSLRGTRPRPASCSTSSTSCATSRERSTRCAAASTAGSPARTPPSSRASGTPSGRGGAGPGVATAPTAALNAGTVYRSASGQ